MLKKEADNIRKIHSSRSVRKLSISLSPQCSGCTLSFSKLLSLKSVIANYINEDETTEINCGSLILKTINVSSKLRNISKKKAYEFDTLYNEAVNFVINLKEAEQNLNASLSSVPGNLRKQYGKVFVNSTNQIKEIRQVLRVLLKLVQE